MNKITKLFKIADQETKKGNYIKAVEAYREILRLSKDDKRTQHIAHWGIGDIYLNRVKLWFVSKKLWNKTLMIVK